MVRWWVPCSMMTRSFLGRTGSGVWGVGGLWIVDGGWSESVESVADSVASCSSGSVILVACSGVIVSGSCSSIGSVVVMPFSSISSSIRISSSIGVGVMMGVNGSVSGSFGMIPCSLSLLIALITFHASAGCPPWCPSGSVPLCS